MLASELLGLTVVDEQHRRLGAVVDIRLAAPRDPHDQVPTVLFGFLVSPHSRLAYRGYQRSGVNRPVLVAHLLHWWHRGSFVVAWQDVARIDDTLIVLRHGFDRYSASLGSAAK